MMPASLPKSPRWKRSPYLAPALSQAHLAAGIGEASRQHPDGGNELACTDGTLAKPGRVQPIAAESTRHPISLDAVVTPS